MKTTILAAIAILISDDGTKKYEFKSNVFESGDLVGEQSFIVDQAELATAPNFNLNVPASIDSLAATFPYFNDLRNRDSDPQPDTEIPGHPPVGGGEDA